MKWYNSCSCFEHFYIGSTPVHYDNVSTIANFLSALSNVSLNDNPVANLIFSLRDGIVPTDLDLSLSPSTDPAVRTLVEQLRTEFPIQQGMPDKFSTDDIFNSIIPNRAQFGAEINTYIDNLSSVISDGISDVKSFESSQHKE